jgi:hypothetical protein
MRIRQILTLPIVALVFLVDPPLLRSVAEAADITAPGYHVKAFNADDKKTDPYWPTDPVLCDLVLDGKIKENRDAKLLEQAFQTIVGTMNSFTFFLCLRSEGGDFREAVKIAQWVLSTQRPSIATVIEDGQTCASACAIIFLAGNAPARVGAWPQRFLHPRGRLLFHASLVDLSQYSDEGLLALLKEPTTPGGVKGKIVDLYKLGSRDVQSVIAAFQTFSYQREDVGDHWVRPSLFLEMFSQDPDEWMCVENVDAVGRWNIQVYGYQPPKPPNKQNYSNVCRSAYHWRSDRFVVGADYDLEDEGELKRPPASTQLGRRDKSNARFDDRFTMSFQAELEPVTCVIELNYGNDPATDSKKKQLDDQSTLTTYFLNSGSFKPGSVIIWELAPTAYYPAATLLRDLPGVRPVPNSGAPRTRPAVGFTDYPNTVMKGCSYRSIPKIERGGCQAACAVDPAYQAYSHNKITQACDLKHKLTAGRLDPLWTSGAPSAGPAPGRSIRDKVMVGYEYSENVGIAGKLIDEAKAESPEACSDRCGSDQMCVALEFEESTNLCRRFSEVTGFLPVPVHCAPKALPNTSNCPATELTIKTKKQQ